MPSIQAAQLTDLVLLAAHAMGSSEAEARDVAEHLVAANLSGHDSHGVGMLPDYVRLLQEGLLVPNQRLELVADKGGVLVFDARRGFGQAMAKEAMRQGIERARAQGSVTVALRNSGHIGRIGHWAEQCAAAGMVSVHFVNVADHSPLQAPYGCSDARLGTNPFAAAVPGPGAEPELLLDMATSAIAFGKARVARNKGVPVPEGVLIDEHGRPTTDPTTYVDTRQGALLAFGAHKGSGMAIMSEVLGGGGHRRGHPGPAPRAEGRHPQQHAFLHPRHCRARRSGAHRRRDRGRGRLGEGLPAGAGLRRDPPARRARAARP